MTATPEAPTFMGWTWADIEPHYEELQARVLDEETLDAFMRDWSAVAERVQELGERLRVATGQNTADEEASVRYRGFVTEVSPHAEQAEQRLKEKLLASGLEPEGMAVLLRRMRVDAALFRTENLPLLAQEKILSEEYFKITGAQTAEWDGREIPLTQLRLVLQDQDRDRRERAWRRMAERRLQDRSALDAVWRQLLGVRQQLAANAGYGDYRSYRWQELKRFDYSPRDAGEFHRAVEEVVVPAMARRYEQRRQRLGVEILRPWDREVDPLGRPPLQPYANVDELITRTSAIFHRVDPTFGAYFDTMRAEGLLDLESRTNKAPMGYCTIFGATRRPFIFMNGTGTRLDVETLLHEGGHAFHAFEMGHLPYFPQRDFDAVPMEFVEVGSMAMELLADPYLGVSEGGFYAPEDAVRTRLDHLEQRVLALWPSLVTADAFQHWVYEHPDEAADPARCDAVWAELVRRYTPVIDWSGLEREMAGGWRDILHIFVMPFYIVEYAFAQLGAVQVWASAQQDQAAAVRRYRQALSLGATASLPDLFAAAGARFAFDGGTLQEAVALIEETIEQLEAEQAACI